MKKPIIYSFSAVLYIIVIAFVMNSLSERLPGKTMVAPMIMLSLFVLSAAIMGFLFFSEPLYLYMNNKKKEAISFFFKTIGCFAGFVAILLFFILFL
ncbi:MAG: hypothetical protein IT215_05765 [Chitinophagaceae bacterium]|nr:hypothetical protein [Chitinophagaceae bacterium]